MNESAITTNKEEDPIKKLDERLRAAGIDTSTWGKGPVKTLAHLQKEIDDRETILFTNNEGKLVRKITVGAVDVLYIDPDGKKYRLREDKQVFKKNGAERRRNSGHAVSGKIKIDEDPKEATIREIREELGISGEISLQEMEVVDEELLTSESYPGLQSQYIVYKYDLVLNDTQFKKDGYVEEQVGITTYFVWEEI